MRNCKERSFITVNQFNQGHKIFKIKEHIRLIHNQKLWFQEHISHVCSGFCPFDASVCHCGQSYFKLLDSVNGLRSAITKRHHTAVKLLR